MNYIFRISKDHETQSLTASESITEVNNYLLHPSRFRAKKISRKIFGNVSENNVVSKRPT